MRKRDAADWLAEKRLNMHPREDHEIAHPPEAAEVGKPMRPGAAASVWAN
jgi:hypothetical protein